MKQKTAVTKLIERLKDDWNISLSDNVVEFYLEKEKEQIIKAGNSCALKQHLHNDRINKMTESELKQFAKEKHSTFGEQYYKENYT